MKNKNIYQEDHTKVPELFVMIENGSLDQVKEIIEREPELVNLKGWMDNSPLHIACQFDKVDIIDFLIKKGGNVNAFRDGVYPSVLEWCNSREAIRLVYSNGARILPLALESPTRGNRTEVVDFILEHRNEELLTDGGVLLINSIEMLSVYQKHKVDVSLPKDNNGRNLLHKLSWSNQVELFDKAINIGVPFQGDNWGYTPYDMALSSRNGREDIISHIELKYARLINENSKIEVNDREIDLSSHKVLNYDYSLDLKKIVVLREGNVVVVYKTDENGEAIFDRSIKISAPPLNSIVAVEKYLYLPLYGDSLCKISLENYEYQVVNLNTKEVYHGIGYIPKYEKFVLLSTVWTFSIFTSTFQKESAINAKDGILNFQVLNGGSNLISCYSYDQGTFYRAYTYGLSSKGDLEISNLELFYYNWKDPSNGFCFENDSSCMYVGFNDTIEKYEYGSDGLTMIWKYNLNFPSKEYPTTTLFDLGEKLWVKRDNKIFTLSKVTGKLIDYKEESNDMKYLCIEGRIFQLK